MNSISSIISRIANRDEDLSSYFGKNKLNKQPGLKLNSETLQGYLLTGKFINLKESNQFVEKPISEFSDRTEAPDYGSMVQMHLDDGEVAFGLDLHTAVIAGRGFHYSAAKPAIKDKVEDFSMDFGMDEFTSIAVMESLGYGDSVYRYTDPASKIDIEHLPVTEFQAVNWDETTRRIKEYDFNTAVFDAYEILHLNWRSINASPFGHGLLAPLVNQREYQITRNDETSTKYRKPISQLKPEMQDVARLIMQRYIPRLWVPIQQAFGGPKATIATNFMNKLKSLEPTEDIADPTGSTPVSINENTRAIDWDSWEKVFRNEIIAAMENPAIRIFTEPGFTKANADAALEAVKMLLQGFSRKLATTINNKIIRPWYELDPFFDANGVKVPWKDAGIQFNWGPFERAEINLEDLMKLSSITIQNKSILKFTEARRNLRRFDIDLDEDDEIEGNDIVAPTAAQQDLAKAEMQRMRQKLELAESKLQATRKELKESYQKSNDSIKSKGELN